MVLNLKTYEYVKNYFFENKLKNLILFSQARSGSTFVSKALSEYLGFSPNKVFSEEYFIGRHYSYLKFFIKKNNNFFCNTNEFVYRRTDLKKENTLFLYLYREPKEILASYEKAKKNNYYLGWNELYERYKKFYPEIDQSLDVCTFNHLIWEKQMKHFDHALTLSFDSFKKHKDFLKDRSEIKTLKHVPIRSSMQNKINFNLVQKIYFFIRRKTDSRKKSLKNY
tara:strand:- start:503 stop:1174 length:672 start_codon:yes stop_codon:yes gene_type:complete